MKNVTLQTDYKDPSSFTIAGKGVPVKDAREKVTGTLKFAVDMKIQGMVYSTPESSTLIPVRPRRFQGY